MNSHFFDSVRRSFYSNKDLAFSFDSFKIDPNTDISMKPEDMENFTTLENNALLFLQEYYTSEIYPLFEKYIPSDYKLSEITNGYNNYYNKYLAVLAYVISKRVGMKNPELPALVVAQFFSLFFVIDDLWDQSTERFGKPCYWVTYGKEKTLEDVTQVLNFMEESFVKNNVPEGKKIIESFRKTSDIWSTIYKQEYGTDSVFSNCINRWYLMNNILFTAFSLYNNNDVLDLFSSFSLGTHVLNDLKDMQGKNEDIVSGQYSFALSLTVENTSPIEIKDQLIRLIGKPDASKFVPQYLSLVKQLQISEKISRLSVSLLKEHAALVSNLLKEESPVSITNWIQARIGRILSGGYLINDTAAQLSKRLGSKDTLQK